MNLKLFLSYASEDRNKMESLYRTIKKIKGIFEPIVITKRRTPGKPLVDKIKEGILESDFFIPIITRYSIENQWVNQEIGFATAKDITILSLIETDIKKRLKGFIHDQMDLPFDFKANESDLKKEAINFRKCYKELLNYIMENYTTEFKSSITPKTVKKGEHYTTKVYFKGKVKNGFFDNYVKHLESPWDRWNWDPGTLKRINRKAAGELHGIIAVKNEYTWSTVDWPKGKFNIYVRLYDHLVPGEIGRVRVAEEVHEFEVI